MTDRDETTSPRRPGRRPEDRLRGRAVVITGASSGIGRATALAFARRGARVAVAARRGDLLEEVARECRAFGVEAIAVPTDVTDANAVARLAEEADKAFGGVDVWVNNAGVGVIGAFGETDLALHRRVVEVNLFGAMHGAHAAFPIFRRQGRGTLLNTVSVGAWAPTPFAASYTASKFALRGFLASLRQEWAAHEGLRVCGVFPAVVDTPGLEHGANLSGRSIDPGPLLYAPEDVAEAHVALALRPRDEAVVGWPSRAAQVSFALFPRATEHGTGALVRWALGRARPDAPREGAILRTAPEGRGVSGGWRARKGVPSAGTIDRALGLALLGGLAVAVLARAARFERRS